LSYANGYDQVQYKNGYKAGTQVTQYFYRNERFAIIQGLDL